MEKWKNGVSQCLIDSAVFKVTMRIRVESIKNFIWFHIEAYNCTLKILEYEIL